MAIRIIEQEPDVRITREKYQRMVHEYNSATMMMVNPPDFETWLRRQLNENQQLLQE